jgi:glutamate racemase
MDCAFFPYGTKSKEFLIKRCIYLIEYLKEKCDKIIIACNTLSLLVLPVIKGFFTNVYGVFDDLKVYILPNSIIIGSKMTIDLVSLEYSNKVIDGTSLINAIQNNLDYKNILFKINKEINGYDNIILACTHFLKLKDEFIIKSIKNI